MHTVCLQVSLSCLSCSTVDIFICSVVSRLVQLLRFILVSFCTSYLSSIMWPPTIMRMSITHTHQTNTLYTHTHTLPTYPQRRFEQTPRHKIWSIIGSFWDVQVFINILLFLPKLNILFSLLNGNHVWVRYKMHATDQKKCNFVLIDDSFFSR